MTIKGFNDLQNANSSARTARSPVETARADRNGRTAGAATITGSSPANETNASTSSRGSDTASIRTAANAADDTSVVRGELKKLNARSLDNLNRVNQKIRDGEYSKPEVIRETAERMLSDLSSNTAFT